MTPSIWLRDLASYGLQLAILIGVGGLLARLFRLRAPAPALAYWQTLLVACLVLPVCQPWRQSAPTAAQRTATPATGTAIGRAAAAADAAPGSPWPVAEAALLIVGAGIAARGAWLVLGLWALRRLRLGSGSLSPELPPLRRAQGRLGVQAGFYVSSATSSPITFGLRRPVVLLPPSVLGMEPEAQEAIVYHELLHVRRRDWIHSVVEECVRSLLWFHPGIWWLIGRIHLAREQVVDQAVVRLTESREGYVAALLAVAGARAQPALMTATLFVRRGFLKKRVAQIFGETTMSKGARRCGRHGRPESAVEAEARRDQGEYREGSGRGPRRIDPRETGRHPDGASLGGRLEPADVSPGGPRGGPDRRRDGGADPGAGRQRGRASPRALPSRRAGRGDAGDRRSVSGRRRSPRSARRQRPG